MVGQADHRSMPRDLSELEVRAQPEGHCHQRRCVGVRSQAGEVFTAGRRMAFYMAKAAEYGCQSSVSENHCGTDRDTNCSGLPRTEGFPRMWGFQGASQVAQG